MLLKKTQEWAVKQALNNFYADDKINQEDYEEAKNSVQYLKDGKIRINDNIENYGGTLLAIEVKRVIYGNNTKI